MAQYPFPHSSFDSFHTDFSSIPTVTTGDYNGTSLTLPSFTEAQMAANSYSSRPLQVHDELNYASASSVEDLHHIPRLSNAASESGASVQSTSSSAMASPSLYPQSEWGASISMRPNSLTGDDFRTHHHQDFSQFHIPTTADVDHHKLNSFINPQSTFTTNYPMNTLFSSPVTAISSQDLTMTAPVDQFEPRIDANNFSMIGKMPRERTFSVPYHPYHFNTDRRPSASSILSHRSSGSEHYDSIETPDGKGVCPHPECGRTFKDLKAHLLTHQVERPEKCPIESCEYHVKGFARKYDKNRHTLTHYKGTMVCGFCDRSSPDEKTFNRADVFKRHLTQVHNVEQVPPNSRRKSPGSRRNTVPGQSVPCSTCHQQFNNVQDFYEHIDDCVLRVVQRKDPAEDINKAHLTSINEVPEVKSTLEKHNLSTSTDSLIPEIKEEDDEDDEADDELMDDETDPSFSLARKSKKNAGAGTSWNGGRIQKRKPGQRGMTWSVGGQKLNATTTPRKRKRDFPPAWGAPSSELKYKKRVMCVFDGPRRLCKDDMMLNFNSQVIAHHLPPPPGEEPHIGEPRYVTDLDRFCMMRADAIYGATEAERGPWVPDNIVLGSNHHGMEDIFPTHL